MKKKVSDWVQKTGFALEMRVAKSFDRACAGVDQSRYYSDPVTKKLREIDVVAHQLAMIDKEIVEFTYVIECKHSKDKPWVLFTHERDQTRDDILPIVSIPTTKNGAYLLLEITSKGFHRDNYIFHLPARIGHGVTCAFQDNRDMAYGAVNSAVHAAHALNAKKDEYGLGTALRGYSPLQVAMPVVVVDGMLFEAYLDETGGLEVGEIDRGVLFQGSTAAEGASSRIEIVPMKALDAYIDGIQRGWDSLRPAIEVALEKTRELVRRDKAE